MLDFILPPLCPHCETRVQRMGGLCPACAAGLKLIAAPHCALCGLPFPYEMGEDCLCAGCLAHTPHFVAARAATVYDDHSRGLILALKHGDQTELAELLGGWMARAGRDLCQDADALIPVPLHWTRLWHRRYNQSVLLAQAVGKQVDRPVWSRLLRRRRMTPSQKGHSRVQRRANVGGAFWVPPHLRHKIVGVSLVLVDDVLTTGATVDEAARVLLRAGAAKVTVLTAARVVPAS